MKRIFALLFLMLVFLAVPAFADTCGKALTGPFVPGQATALCKSFGSAVTRSMIPSSSDSIDLGSSSKSWANLYIGTSVNFAAASGVRMAGYVPTLAATAAAGTNDFKLGRNAVPTAAANTVGCLPVSPTEGDTVIIENGMANAVRAKACGTPGVNGGAAGTYMSVAAWTRATLRYNSTLVTWFGSSEAVPTPAGP